jgi:ADP-ribosylglycohydrolase
VGRLAGGAARSESGEDSAGNGAAMRMAPVGLVYAHDLAALRRAAALSSLPTHRGRSGLVATIAQAEI